jgi:hypothetical protein
MVISMMMWTYSDFNEKIRFGILSVLCVPLISDGAFLVDSIFWCSISFRFRWSSLPHGFISLTACNGAVRREKIHLFGRPQI